MSISIDIPIVTDDEPYIEFRYDKDSKLTLSKSSKWWGGMYGGFSGSDGQSGNTCLPIDLIKYIKAFNTIEVDSIEDEIKSLTLKLEDAKLRAMEIELINNKSFN